MATYGSSGVKALKGGSGGRVDKSRTPRMTDSRRSGPAAPTSDAHTRPARPPRAPEPVTPHAQVPPTPTPPAPEPPAFQPILEDLTAQVKHTRSGNMARAMYIPPRSDSIIIEPASKHVWGDPTNGGAPTWQIPEQHGPSQWYQPALLKDIRKEGLAHPDRADPGLLSALANIPKTIAKQALIPFTWGENPHETLFGPLFCPPPLVPTSPDVYSDHGELSIHGSTAGRQGRQAFWEWEIDITQVLEALIAGRQAFFQTSVPHPLTLGLVDTFPIFFLALSDLMESTRRQTARIFAHYVFTYAPQETGKLRRSQRYDTAPLANGPLRWAFLLQTWGIPYAHYYEQIEIDRGKRSWIQRALDTTIPLMLTWIVSDMAAVWVRIRAAGPPPEVGGLTPIPKLRYTKAPRR